MRPISLFIFFIGISFGINAQTPDTDIYIADYIFDGNLKIEKLYNFTNREGYDNQPFFHPENKWLYFSSIRNDGQSDVYRYEWEEQKIFKVTDTYEDEFSPQLIPGKNAFSTVRVEFNQKQRLWSFDILNPEMPELLFPDIERVGYSAWINAENLALFIVATDEKTHELILVNTKSQSATILDSMIGRALAIRPDYDQLLYVSKADSLNWMLKSYDLKTGNVENLAPALNKSEDYCWLNSNIIISGNANRIYKLDLNSEDLKWSPLLDLENVNGEIERIAIHRVYQRIAFVVNKSL